MIRSHRLVSTIVSLAVFSGLTACAGTEGLSLNNPTKYNFYSCALLNENGELLTKRERELESLMQKAAQGPGGELVNAIAYRNEYNITKGDLREIERVGAEKRCVLKYRSVSDQVVR